VAAKKSANRDDVMIGARLRTFRMERGISQEKLGDMIGLTFQQVQKYEKGVNRIGGSRMLQIARAMDMPIAAFFGQDGNGKSIKVDTFVNSPSRRKLVNLCISINDSAVENAISDLIVAILRGRNRDHKTHGR
jgi:transcriptional regulator with XRE-family HTH domain